MKISREEIDRIANLSKLQFDPQEKEKIEEDVNRIVSFIDKLNELDTDDVEPLEFMTEEVNTLRADKKHQTLTQEEALRNAPQKDSDYIKIPKVLDK